jgi:DNA-binding NarL/FixJ family response regulator
MQNPTNHIVIADNQFLITEALQRLLLDEFGFRVDALVGNKHDLTKALADLPESLLIIDYNHIDMEGIVGIHKLMLSTFKGCVMVLVNSLQKKELNQLSAMGIMNVMLKTAQRDELIAGIHSALSGKKHYCQEVLAMLTETNHNKPAAKEEANLTISEIAIIREIADGFTTKQIAAKRFISYHTVMTHRKNIFRKLAVNNSSELVMLAIRKGIVDVIDYQI